jgi:hypothetical protein
MLTRHWLAVVAGVAVLAAALGRYSAPVHTETVERVKVVEVEKQVVAIQERVRVERVEVESAARQVHRQETTTRAPDGTVTRQRTVDENTEQHRASSTAGAVDSSTHVETTHSASTEGERRQVVDVPRADWRVGVLAGVDTGLRPTWGALVERRLLGPVSLGAWALGIGAGGVVLTLEF